MKSFLSLPGNNDFFTRYASLVPTLHKLGYIAQVVSALTEIGIIYSLAFTAIIEVLPSLAVPMAAAVAILGTAFLEVGLRTFLPFSVRAILHKRFKGLDLAMTVFILATCTGLLISSGLLSFKGSKEMVETVKPPAEQRTTAGADSSYQVAEARALATFRADSTAIADRYRAQIDAIRTAAASEIASEKQALTRLSVRERSTGQTFSTQKATIRERISQLEARRDAQAAELTGKQADELSAAQQQRGKALEAAGAELATAKGEVKQFNSDALSKNERQFKGYGAGLAWFTVVCLFVLIFSVILHEIHHKGSEIAEQVQPSQYDFSQGVFSEFLEAVNNRLQYLLRSRIAAFDEATPDPPLPVLPGALYALDGFDQRRFVVQMNAEPEEERKIVLRAGKRPAGRSAGWISPASAESLEETAMQYVQAVVELEGKNLHAAANDMHLKAVDVLRAYLGPAGTDEAVQELYGALVRFFNGQGPNPFEQHHRRPIGFYQASEPAVIDNPDKGSFTKGSFTKAGIEPKGCEHCGKMFSPKVVWQKYCSEACRDAFHTEKNGEPFDPKLYHKAKRKGGRKG